VVELHHVSDECQQLKSTLNKVESECVTAQSEVRNLSGKVRNLECVLEEMHKAAENRREIERQHKEVISLNFLALSHFASTNNYPFNDISAQLTFVIFLYIYIEFYVNFIKNNFFLPGILLII
jgi:hypothetical protein